MKKFFVFFLLACHSFLTSHEPDLLKESDVHRIMQQILQNHLGNKDLTSKIWQNAIKIYINQFDPDHVYLLSSETSPFLDMSTPQLEATETQYEKNNFKVFEDLNAIFQKAIQRAQVFRHSPEFNQEVLLPLDQNFIPYAYQAFANNLAELKERQVLEARFSLQEEMRRHGESKMNRNKAALMNSYNEKLTLFENQYLFLDEQNHALPKAEKENLLTIHILKALANSLDAHTSFYEASEAYDIKTRLKKEVDGVGLELHEKPNSGPVVSHLVPGGPAEKNGSIKAGDMLVKIDGQSILTLPMDQILEKIHEGKNASVSLEFNRKDADGKESTYQVSLERTIIPLKTDRVDVRSESFGNGIIGILTLHSFYQNENGISSENDLREAIQQLQQKAPLKGLILDLRDNSGGFLSQAVKVAGLFITKGVIVISKYADGEEKIYRDVDGKMAYDGPLIILVSKITASAAEIVTQALQDYGVAVIVGDKHTYGKGTIQMQTVTDNQSSSYFKVTVGKYYTVSGRTPQKNGVISDIEAPGHWNDAAVGEQYLDSSAPDSIASKFNDTLDDLSPSMKAWYMKYYVPKVQLPIYKWHELLPTLRKNSQIRIANNKNYQYYLHGGIQESEEDTDNDWLEADNKEKQNFGEDDLQLQETLAIMKDMIMLRNGLHKNS